jgi:hypothetical protein
MLCILNYFYLDEAIAIHLLLLKKIKTSLYFYYIHIANRKIEKKNYKLVILIIMSNMIGCHYNCEHANFVFLVRTVLHRDELNREYIQRYLFCSSKCLQKFKNKFIIEDENGCEYHRELLSYKYDPCYLQMKEKVDEYKKQRMQTKQSTVTNIEPLAKVARVD